MTAATFCADPHPFDPRVLCRRLDGHSGVHAADPDIAWETCPPGCRCHTALPDPTEETP